MFAGWQAKASKRILPDTKTLSPIGRDVGIWGERGKKNGWSEKVKWGAVNILLTSGGVYNFLLHRFSCLGIEFFAKVVVSQKHKLVYLLLNVHIVFSPSFWCHMKRSLYWIIQLWAWFKRNRKSLFTIFLHLPYDHVWQRWLERSTWSSSTN